MGKCIHFFELTGAGLAHAVGYRLFGYEVSYFRISNALSRNRAFNRLGRLGFRGMSYADIPAPEINRFFKRYARLFAQFFENRVRLTELEAAIDRHFGLDERASMFAWRGLRQRMQMRWFEMALVADHFGRDTSIAENTLKLPPGGLARELVEALPARPATVGPSLLEMIAAIVRAILKLAAGGGRSIISRLALPHAIKAAPAAAIADPRQFEVVYFPHQGIAYGELFVKDQYYATEPESPFSAQRILHLATSRADEPGAASVRYYLDHGLAFDSFDRISPFGWRQELATLLRFLRIAIRVRVFSIEELLRWKGYRLAAHYFAFRMLARFAAAVRALPSVRVALVGYDVLFSPWLAAALSAAGVQTVATQERLVLPFYGHLDVFVDRYLVCGERIRREIEGNPVSFGGKELAVVGPPRAEHIRELANQAVADEKYGQIRKRSFLILALDYHTAKTWDGDRMARVATWEVVRTFYEDMLRLASCYPNVHIVIKGKDLSNLANPHLSEVIGRIKRQENIEIEPALDRYTPAYMASMVDLGIALHTSLGDEMLAAGKPCLFYDRSGFLDELYDYDGFPVIVRSFEELAERVGRMLCNGQAAFMEEEDFAELRSYLYGQGEETTRQRIHEQLTTVLTQSRSMWGSA